MAVMVARSHLRSILNYFPTNSTLYVFEHWASAFPACSSGTEKLSDVIFVVDDPVAWHEGNLSMNSSHYSFLKYFGAKAMARIQDKWACGIYNNPSVLVNNMLIRYGVISAKSLNTDLLHWKHLRVAAKLQTPVVDIKPPICAELINNLKRNHMAALHAVLLQLPAEATKYELYYGITSLSYSGDFRLYIDEDPRSIKDFVSPLVSEFDQIYLPLIESLKPLVKLDKRRKISLQKHTPETTSEHLLGLLSKMQIRLARRFRLDLQHLDVEEASNLAKVLHIDMYVSQTTSSIVNRSKAPQVLQDALTAGFWQSIKFGIKKFRVRSSIAESSGAGLATASAPAPAPIRVGPAEVEMGTQKNAEGLKEQRHIHNSSLVKLCTCSMEFSVCGYNDGPTALIKGVK